MHAVSSVAASLLFPDCDTGGEEIGKCLRKRFIK